MMHFTVAVLTSTTTSHYAREEVSFRSVRPNFLGNLRVNLKLRFVNFQTGRHIDFGLCKVLDRSDQDLMLLLG